jgi:hypothetical protein
VALIEYKSKSTDRVCYVFGGEEPARLPTDVADWEPQPPNPIIVHTTNSWMSESTIDSYHTTYELDRQLNIEAGELREMKLINQVRKNL